MSNINYNQVKQVFDNAEWFCDPEPIDDNETIHTVLEWLHKVTFSIGFLKQAVQHFEEDGIEIDSTSECVFCIENAIAFEKLMDSSKMQKLGINFNNYYFYIKK